MKLEEHASSAPVAGMDQHDLGPLAWVLDELRKVLDSTGKTLRRFAREVQAARTTGAPVPEATMLQPLPQQYRQAAGALEMVDMSGAAMLLRPMEAAAAEFIDRPDQCTSEAASVMERAGGALVEYLEAVLAGRPLSAVALFAQYREVAELGEGEKVHPADLWTHRWDWVDPGAVAGVAPLQYDSAVRGRLDQAVLRIVKGADRTAAREIAALSLGFAAARHSQRSSVFWQISAAFFEAFALEHLPADLYVKRLASRLLMQYSALARGDDEVPQPLLRDLLFFCAQARTPSGGGAAPVLARVRAAFGLERLQPVDYEQRHFGRFDAALLAQMRKRIQSAAETWSAVAGGDVNKLRVASEQFQQLADAMVQLQPASVDFARALARVVDDAQRAGRAPMPALAMEVATSVLYLQAAYDDLDQDDALLNARLGHMAERLKQVRSGGQSLPLESWMEELYSRVSDRRTMGSVVAELRANLAEVEKLLDQCFRDSGDPGTLPAVSNQLSQMRGVLSVLGLEQASQAVVQMRNSIDHFAARQPDAAAFSGDPACETIGNSLGALGFLIDMLGYQPALAKKLFVFDAASGELRPVMGRTTTAEPLPASEVTDQQSVAVAAEALPDPAPVDAAAEAAETVDLELLEIFLEEAREVVANGAASVERLAAADADVAEHTALRRAFHTLKGSSRMVGLAAFGDAAWSMEQLHNVWLAEQKPADARLLRLSGSALRGFGRWADAIAEGRPAAWTAAPFQVSADALRLEDRLVELELPDSNRLAQPVAAAAPDIAEPAARVAAPAEPADVGAEAICGSVEPELIEIGATELSVESGMIEFAAAVADATTDEAAPALPLLDVSEPSQDAVPLAAGPASIEEAEPLSLELPVLPCEPEAEAAREADAGSQPAREPSQPGDVHAARSADTSSEERESTEPGRGTDLPPLEEAAPVAIAEPIEAASPPPAPEGRDDEIRYEPIVDESFKFIGDLRVSIPLYTVYLAEADEWSRCLQTELSEWALDPRAPLPDLAIAMAHSLGGSSSTVGFAALATLARRFEKALAYVQLAGHADERQAQTFADASNDVSRLLRHFAAGQLRDADPAVLRALGEVLDSRPAASDASTSTGFAAVDAAVVQRQGGNQIEPAATGGPSVLPLQPAAATVPAQAGPAAIASSMPAPIVAGAAAGTRLPVPRLDDDIDALDVVDPDLFPIFEDEALELLPRLGGALRGWAARPEQRDARAEVMRCLHTLKGSARLAGAMRLGEMAHRMESRIDAHGEAVTSAGAIEPLLLQFDALQAQFDTLRGVGVRNEPVVVPAVASEPQVTVVPAAARPAVAPAVVAVHAAQRPSSQSVRVRSQLLDRLVNQAGEIMMTRARLESRVAQLRASLADLTGNLDRLRQQLRDVELQAETQMQSRLAQSKDSGAGFDPLEFDRFTRVQELTRMMAESVNDVATVQRNVQRAVEGAEDDLVAQTRQSRELQRDLLRTRMVEFEGISERLYGVVRQAAKETGKQVKLDITGGSIEMDRGMLDRLAPAFEHLLRNAVAHGIEPPQQRAAEGKPAVGAIGIDLRQSGNEVSVSFRDDGAGLALDRIRQKALERQLVAPDQQLSDAQAMQLIFAPGFSTAAAVTELAGRGVGMDVVRSEVNALGGRIETDSKPGQGTGFTLVLPLTTAVTQVVMLRAGAQTIGVPSAVVELVRRVPSAEIEAAYASGTLGYGGETIPFFWCGALLQSSSRTLEPGARTRPVLIIRSASQRLALHVDEVLGNQEVVVKNLGPQLAKLPGLAGMSVLPSGAVALIYNPVALATVYGPQARQWAAAQDGAVQAAGSAGRSASADESRQAPLVLVVDDSITVRRVTQRLLQREGFRVALAADGLQAIERLSDELPVLVVSDIEMPRMDGFDLVRNIRGDVRTADLPVVMITSRIGHKHREHATELGVQHYLGKPYSEEELLRLARHYARARLATPAELQ